MLSPYISIHDGHIYCTLKGERVDKCPCYSHGDTITGEDGEKKFVCPFAKEDEHVSFNYSLSEEKLRLTATHASKYPREPVCTWAIHDKCVAGCPTLYEACYDEERSKECQYYVDPPTENKNGQDEGDKSEPKSVCPCASRTHCLSTKAPLFEGCYVEDDYLQCPFYNIAWKANKDFVCPQAKDGKCSFTGYQLVDKCFDEVECEECIFYKKPKEDKSCFISTACIRNKDLSDNCYELNLLREYRDKYLRTFEVGRNDVQKYYMTAPLMVAAINERPDKNEIYDKIYTELVQPCVKLIEDHKYAEAHNHYRDYVDKLATLLDESQ